MHTWHLTKWPHSSSSPLQHFTAGYPLQCTYTDWVLPPCNSSTFRISDANALCTSLLPSCWALPTGTILQPRQDFRFLAPASASQGGDLLSWLTSSFSRAMVQDFRALPPMLPTPLPLSVFVSLVWQNLILDEANDLRPAPSSWTLPGKSHESTLVLLSTHISSSQVNPLTAFLWLTHSPPFHKNYHLASPRSCDQLPSHHRHRQTYTLAPPSLCRKTACYNTRKTEAVTGGVCHCLDTRRSSLSLPHPPPQNLTLSSNGSLKENLSPRWIFLSHWRASHILSLWCPLSCFSSCLITAKAPEFSVFTVSPFMSHVFPNSSF